MTGEEEVFSQCPYCFSPISLLLEAFYSEQEYIEDCEVCCRPLNIRYRSSEGQVQSLEVTRLDE